MLNIRIFIRKTGFFSICRPTVSFIAQKGKPLGCFPLFRLSHALSSKQIEYRVLLYFVTASLHGWVFVVGWIWWWWWCLMQKLTGYHCTLSLCVKWIWVSLSRYHPHSWSSVATVGKLHDFLGNQISLNTTNFPHSRVFSHVSFALFFPLTEELFSWKWKIEHRTAQA